MPTVSMPRPHPVETARPSKAKPRTVPQLYEPAADDIAAELRRELKLRKQVYPRLLMTHRLTQRDAEWRIRIIEAAIKHFERVASEVDTAPRAS